MKTETNILKKFHHFGCPVYVLGEDLKGDTKQHKWKQRTKVGMYLGRSKHHAADVSLILNTKANFITPQYHVLFDDDFHSVTSASEKLVNKHGKEVCNNINMSNLS